MIKQPAKISSLGYDLPELDDVDPFKEPWRHFAKGLIPGQLTEVPGRRPSPQLCVPKLRAAVGAWRESNYTGASETTKRLFQWWFLEARSGDSGFKPYFAQREAIETIVYLLEIFDAPNVRQLIEQFHEIQAKKLVDTSLEFEHNKDGELQVQIPGHGAGIPLEPANAARYAIKAATGSGKTMIMALYVTWSYFHSTRESGSTQASNFLIVAPNVIVFERLKVDFANSKLFRDLQLAPPGWSLDLHVILRGDAIEPVARGNLVVTNVQQLYETREKWTPKNVVEKILGRAVVKGAAPGRAILARVQSLKSLAVLNDEAHHVHDPDLEWNQILTRLHRGTPDGLAAWLDFSATPRFDSGAFFPWVISDYPLAQAVEDQIVKTPILVKSHLSEREGKKKPKKQTKVTANQYAVWIRLGVERLKALEGNYKGVAGAKPVMFVMCENVAHAEDVAKFLKDGRQGFGIKDEEVLVIHTKGSGEIKDGDLDELRRQSRLIDQAESKIRIVVSVLILREGWDVRNVSVVLGLRPANSKNEILPEQAVGRGLRLMRGVFGRQILEVIGTQSFEDLIGQLEVEGVHVDTTVEPPKQVRIEPLQERKKYDIAIPRTGLLFSRSHKKLADLKAEDIPVNFSAEDLQIDLAKIRVRMIDIASGTELAVTEISPGRAPLEGEVLSAITSRVLASARLVQADYQVLYPIVKRYVTEFAFGQRINLDLDNVRRLLALPVYEQWLAASVADAVGRIVTEFQAVRVEQNPILLSETDKFIWRRQTEKAEKTVFNLMATFNNFESEFGRFLDGASDVRAFSALAETFTRFSVDYLKPTGAMGRYYPDWVIHQRIDKEDRFWIAETKGREFEGVEQKDAAIVHWCSEVSKNGRNKWGYIRVNQNWWNVNDFTSFEHVARGVEVHQKNLGATGLYFWPA